MNAPKIGDACHEEWADDSSVERGTVYQVLRDGKVFFYGLAGDGAHEARYDETRGAFFAISPTGVSDFRVKVVLDN